MTVFYKIKNALAPSYLSDHIPVQNDFGPNLPHRRGRDRVPFTRTDRFSNSFFPFTVKAWEELSDDCKSKRSVQSFKSSLNKFIRPPRKPFFGIRDKHGIGLFTKIRVTFSDLRDHRYKNKNKKNKNKNKNKNKFIYFTKS